MIVQISTLAVIEETYDVSSREEAIERFVKDRGFSSVEQAADVAGLPEDEYRQSLVIRDCRA